MAGSIINVDELSVGESVPIVGTPFSLNYSSSQVPGRADRYQLHVPITDVEASAYETAFGIEVSISYLGKTEKGSFSVAPNQKYDFIWDGLDAAGLPSSKPIPVLAKTDGITVGAQKDWPRMDLHVMGIADPRTIGLGGWMLSDHHRLEILRIDVSHNKYAIFTNKPIAPATPNSVGSPKGWTVTGSGVDGEPDHYARAVLYLGSGGEQTVSAELLGDGTYRVADPSGEAVYIFAADGKHLSTRNPLTNALLYRFTYNSNGQLQSVTDSFNNQTRLLRNTAGIVTGIRSPYGQVTALALNGDGWLKTIRNPNGETHSMTYVDAKGLLKTFKKPMGQIATFAYDGYGLLLNDANSAGNSLHFDMGVNSAGYRSITATSAEGRQSIFDIMFAEGSYPVYFSTTTDPWDVMTATIYAPGERFDSVEIYPTNNRYTEYYTTDPRFADLNVVKQNATQQGIYSMGSTIDSTATWGSSVTPNPFNYTTLTTTTTTNGKATQEVFIRGRGVHRTTTPQGRVNKIITDTYGRVTRIETPGSAPVEFFYDARGRLEHMQQGSRTRYLTYNTQGWVDSAADALNQREQYTYDTAGQMTRLTLPDLRSIDFGYDADGNLVSITPPSRQSHQLAHNLFDLLDTYAPPLLPLLPDAAQVATHYHYNNDKQISQIDRPDGQSIVFNYIPSKAHLASISTPGGDYVYQYSYDKLIGLISPDQIASQLSWQSDLLESETLTDATTGTGLGSVNITYNNDFLPVTITAAGNTGSSALDFAYDQDNLLIKTGALRLARNAKTGFLSATTLGLVTESYAYDPTYGELSAFSAAVSGNTVFSESFVRDNLGRITARTETIEGASAQFAYTYDSAGRLTDVTKEGAAYSHYEYDGNSNRSGGIQDGNAITSAVYDEQDRLLSYNGKTYGYNVNGELQTVADTTAKTDYTYDTLGNLKQVRLPSGKTISYQVDGFNRRVSRAVNGNLTRYYLYQRPLQLVAELDATGKLLTRYVYGSKPNVPEYFIRGTARYKLVTDHLGSVRLVINVATGAVIQRLDYDEFGRVLNDTKPGFQPFGFAGGLYDPDTQLVRFGARDYDAETGRWTDKDPLLFDGGDANLYGYVLNDPINYIDPEGLFSWKDIKNALQNFKKANKTAVDINNANNQSDPVRKGAEYLKALSNWIKTPISLGYGSTMREGIDWALKTGDRVQKDGVQMGGNQMNRVLNQMDQDEGRPKPCQ